MLSEHAKSIIDFEKKKNVTVTKKRIRITRRCKSMLHLWNKILEKTLARLSQVTDHCHYTGKYRGAANSICNLKLNVPNEIPVVFHDGLNYDYHFIILTLF